MSTPQRIASLLASATEILYGLGVGDHVVAVSHECDYPPEVAGKPRVTHSHIGAEQPSQQIDDQVRQLSVEGAPLYGLDEARLRQLAPDLIVTQEQCDVCAVKYEDVLQLVRTDAVFRTTQVLALNPVSLAAIFADIRRVGEAVARPEAARQYVEALQRRVAAVRQKTLSLAAEQRPRVVCVEWTEPLMLAANWTPELIETAGGESGLTVAGQHSAEAKWEDVVDYDPQVLIVSPCGFDLARTKTEAHRLLQQAPWSRLAAVKHSRVYAIDGNAYLNRSGPRIVDTLEILAHLLHPDLFAPPLAPAQRASAWCQLPAAP